MNLGRQAGLVVVNPSGNRTRVALRPLPFLIGRQPGNHLVVRDNRISRTHCRIVAERGDLVIEDTASTHGVFVNGERVTRHPLRDNDKIELGVPDSYQLIFTVEEGELGRLLDRFETGRPAGGGNLANLRAVVEIARVLQSSLSVDEVLAAVVDAALTITSTERGFLLLRDGQDLKIRVARDASGQELPVADLRVPMQLIQRSLQHRRDLLTMNFDPDPGHGSNPDHSVANLELRSVVCVPLVRIRSNHQDQTQDLSRLTEGLIYLDSRLGAADLAAGNRELLQTLALEASTILENARLLEEERQKLHLEEELSVAREIQAGLLPRDLPQDGWFRAAARSMPSHQVGGDYVDVKRTTDGWWAVVADVCGKGVSSALLASLLQGAFLLASESSLPMEDTMARINRFLNERTGGEKYATIFCCALDPTGLLRWTNAGHCPPLLVRRQGKIETLESTGLPVGMIDSAEFVVRESRLQPGDKLVVFTDGLCEAQNDAGEYFEVRRIRNLLRENALTPSGETVKRLMSALQDFTAGAPQADDVTCLVLEYAS
ncbi:MAG: SpoIIE family protein phosphatase [Bryobacteraceae bacterium]